MDKTPPKTTNNENTSIKVDPSNLKSSLILPRVTIKFCTQCRWMLRAAYFAQELLSTFGTDIGEVALQPSTGGTFIVDLFTNANAIPGAKGEIEAENSEEQGVKAMKHTLWDRKSEGGFPETKELKKRLRNIIDPSRDLGHVDGKKSTTSKATSSTTVTAQPITTAMESNSTPTPQASSEPQNQSGTSNPPDASDAPNASAPSYPSDASGVSGEGKETLNERGKLVITGLEGEGGFGVCRPRDEECGGFEI